MRILLDTNVLLWAATDPDRLGPALPVVADPRNAVLVSAASTWELAIKSGLGRITLPAPVDQWIASAIEALDASGIAVEHSHAAAVASLPLHHHDPFDRLLVAQATALRSTLVSSDRAFESYDVELLLI